MDLSLFINVTEWAQKAVDLIQKEGDNAVVVIKDVVDLLAKVSQKDLLGVFAALNKTTVDVNEVVAAIKAAFNLGA